MQDIKIELLPTVVSDAVVVNAARVSFADYSNWANLPEGYSAEQAEKLINYLASHKHTSPFRHIHLTFSFGKEPFKMWELSQYERAGMVTKYELGTWTVQTSFLGWVNLLVNCRLRYSARNVVLTTLLQKAPLSCKAYELDLIPPSEFRGATTERYIAEPTEPEFALATIRVTAPCFIARQLVKHQVGLSWNEESRRYIKTEPAFFKPEAWRNKPEGSVKQGSAGVHEHSDGWSSFHNINIRLAQELYTHMLDDGIAPEMARMTLPQSQLFTWVWSGSLESFAKCYQERIAPGAQQEAQYFARQLDAVMTASDKAELWKTLTK